MKKTLSFILISTALVASCGRTPPTKAQRMLLGTVVNITIADKGTVEDAETELDGIFARLEKLDKLWSGRMEGSDMTSLTANAGLKSHPLDEKTYALLARGTQLQELTDNLFNMRLGPVTDLWGFHTGNPHIPEAWEIKDTLPLVKGAMLFADSSCLLSEKGMKLDFGGIAKGYGVDLAVENMLAAGMKSGIVEAGGDLRTFGTPGKGECWRIGLRHPRQPDEFYAVLQVDECAVATSGDYQQYFERDGKRYHHIIDPRIGYPAIGCLSATVITETCIDADAISTALFVMGPVRGIQWLNEHPEYEGIIVFFAEDGKLTHVNSKGVQYNQAGSYFQIGEGD